MAHFAATRAILRLPCSLVRAPDDLLTERILVQDADKVGYALVGTRHVDVRPHGNRAPGTLGPQPSGRPWPAVHLEPDGADGGPTAGLSLYLGPGAVRRSVVDDDQLIGVPAAVQCPADALHLRSDIQFLVVAGEDNAHLKRPLRQGTRVDFLDTRHSWSNMTHHHGAMSWGGRIRGDVHRRPSGMSAHTMHLPAARVHSF